MRNKTRILLINDYFDPATLAGGPIVSCANLVEYLYDEYEFSILTTNRDLDRSTLLVEADKWLCYKNKAKIFYATGILGVIHCLSSIRRFKPDVVYINGVYSFVCVVVPLLISACFAKNAKIIIAPRGMLLADALNVKRLKKRIYLTLFRRLVALNQVEWHVTGEQERDDLLVFIGKQCVAEISIIGNVPSATTALISRNRNQTTLSLLTIALVSPMKNILNIIEALKNVSGKVVYTVYGSIKEKSYWERCLKEAKKLPQSITFTYGGVAARKDIPAILAKHDIYIQPSKSENFSHSIYEALMSGMPTITSHNTPWRVSEAGAGWNVEGSDINAIAQCLLEANNLADEEYGLMSCNARMLGEEYLLQANLRDGYRKLFALNE